MDAVAGKDWKSSVGFPINYDSAQSSDDDFDTSDVVLRRRPGPRSSRILLEDGGDGAPADLLGTTPPRARIRSKEKRRSHIFLDGEGPVQRVTRESRRNTADNLYDTQPAEPVDRSRSFKRASLKVYRTRERDWKLSTDRDSRADSLPSPTTVAAPAAPTFVESCSRFMSLTSRLKCRAAEQPEQAAEPAPLPPSRVHFHQTFSMLISMGNVDRGCRRTISREEQVWQNELKDLIWLELQARAAGRSLAQQDAFLCERRLLVPAVINNIINYRFVNSLPCRFRSSHLCTSVDEDQTDCKDDDHVEDSRAGGCISFSCPSCGAAAALALREVRTLLESLSRAVALFPSSKAMTADHPLAATQHFSDKLKAMCLWYNMTQHLRMKTLSLRRLVRAVRRAPGPQVATDQVDSGSGGAEASGGGCQVRFQLEAPRRPSDDSGGSPNTDGSAPTTPEPGGEGNVGGTVDTTSSAESGYLSEREMGNEQDDIYTTSSSELTNLRLLNKCNVSPYRQYLHGLLKTQGIRRCLTFVDTLRRCTLARVLPTLQRPQEETPFSEEPEKNNEDLKPEEEQTDPEKQEDIEQLQRYGWWSGENESMRLPSYRGDFLLLSTVCMEVVHDYLEMRLEGRPKNPSSFTVKQIVHELKEGLDIATEVRATFVRNISAALDGYSASAAARADLLLIIRTFDATADAVLKQYLAYLTLTSQEKLSPRAHWEREWSFAARLAQRMPCAAAAAPEAFTDIVCNQISLVVKRFEQKVIDLSKHEENAPSDIDDEDAKRRFVYAICREAQCIYTSERDATLQTVQLGRVTAARLHQHPALRGRIFDSLMSVRNVIAAHTQTILERSGGGGERGGERGVSREVGDSLAARARELLLQVYKLGFELHKELYRVARPPLPAAPPRRPVSLQPPPPSPAPRRRRPETVLINDSVNYTMLHRELHRYVERGARGAGVAAAACAGAGAGRRRPPRLFRMESTIDDYDDKPFHVDADAQQNQSRIELLLSGASSPPPPAGPAVGGGGEAAAAAAVVARAIISFARCWMCFVVERCDRGRGLRPRWASQGLEFLMLACDPHNTRHLTDEEFEELKSEMDGCISHVIGSRPAPRPPASPAARRPHRLNSPMSINPGSSSPPALGSAGAPAPPTPPSEPQPVLDFHGVEKENSAFSQRVLQACQRLDQARHSRLQAARAVGQVITHAVSSDEPKLRQVTFTWQRGLKIGQGTFGKVYTVINTETGQLLAMKELSIGAGDRRARQRAANELRVLEGVLHPHLVRHYGCELHREEMLIFMELCVEGSLEALLATQGGLAEPSVRRYTRQLLSAVKELHHRKIVHRDIKSGNIFLTNEGHCLKLGDFGCAVKIRANTTAVGELQGTVGTQAYMAPEVFMKSSGHGRAADIWSLGCVVAEMASGKRPFPEYDSNYQIMFVVGMGGRPRVPETLSEEGQQFCLACLTHEPELRPRAEQLLTHHFLNMKSEEDCQCEPGYLITKM